MNLKKNYADNHSKINEKSFYLNRRLFNTYNRIIQKKIAIKLSGVNVDLGSGDKGFSEYLKSIGISSFPIDYPSFDLEKDCLEFEDESIDFITMNAVIEHIKNPDNIFKNIKRVLKTNGLVFVRTPNWQLDYINFYNDPTHVKPYTPASLKEIFKLYNLDTIFIEPGLVEKSWFWWKLPNKIKWYVASMLNGGTKSIIGIAKKKR
jgi:2-polyprenyl-3-methyl-5-hydroxy-6-metoxy-1,4-benzoquinol methylase